MTPGLENRMKSSQIIHDDLFLLFFYLFYAIVFCIEIGTVPYFTCCYVFFYRNWYRSILYMLLLVFFYRNWYSTILYMLLCCTVRQWSFFIFLLILSGLGRNFLLIFFCRNGLFLNHRKNLFHACWDQQGQGSWFPSWRELTGTSLVPQVPYQLLWVLCLQWIPRFFYFFLVKTWKLTMHRTRERGFFWFLDGFQIFALYTSISQWKPQPFSETDHLRFLSHPDLVYRINADSDLKPCKKLGFNYLVFL